MVADYQGHLVLIRGVSGSGKTTFAQQFVGAVGYYLIAADDYFQTSEGYHFEAQKLPSAHNWCRDMTETLMFEGANVCVHNTFTTQKEMKPYLDLADKYNYNVSVVVVENYHGNKDVHGVPDQVRENQAKKLAQNLKFL